MAEPGRGVLRRISPRRFAGPPILVESLELRNDYEQYPSIGFIDQTYVIYSMAVDVGVPPLVMARTRT